MYVSDATIQPHPYKGTASECFTMGAQSFTYRIKGLDHRAPPCAALTEPCVPPTTGSTEVVTQYHRYTQTHRTQTHRHTHKRTHT